MCVRGNASVKMSDRTVRALSVQAMSVRVSKCIRRTILSWWALKERQLQSFRILLVSIRSIQKEPIRHHLVESVRGHSKDEKKQLESRSRSRYHLTINGDAHGRGISFIHILDSNFSDRNLQDSNFRVGTSQSLMLHKIFCLSPKINMLTCVLSEVT